MASQQPATAPDSRLLDTLVRRYRQVRRATIDLAAPLSPEDCVAQSMTDASPAKWHLAHTTWFFETFVLERQLDRFTPFRPGYRVLFNSYYNTVGKQHARPARGLLTRPPLDEVLAYRSHVDDGLVGLLQRGDMEPAVAEVIELGLQHEQQHQELILMDIKHLLSANPLRPAYREGGTEVKSEATTAGSGPGWKRHQGGAVAIGCPPDGFAFDNERPRHEVLVATFDLACRLVTSGEYLEFMEDGGYRRPELWLADGWTTCQAEGWEAPLYWERRDGGWQEFTLAGMRPLSPGEPACHVSYYEADAFARWAGARLPTEAEWETAAAGCALEGNFADSGILHPLSADDGSAAGATPGAGDGRPALRQMFGDAWEWTGSPYVAYPGYQPPTGALGEYNGKFMCNQLVMRGGACITPHSHIRATYRNFFYPHMRWQFGGIRLARDPS